MDSNALRLPAALGFAYLLGAVPTGFLLLKRLKGVDLRITGSGNIGATNVTRVAGSGLGRLVFVMDAAKGLIAAHVLAPLLCPGSASWVPLACGAAAVLGHNFPVFLSFRGGKGVATTIGVLLGTMPLVAAGSLLIWALCFAVWRYVSLASLAAALVVPVGQAITRQPAPDLALGAALALLIIVRHGANIQRLRAGTEHRFERAGAGRRGHA